METPVRITKDKRPIYSVSLAGIDSETHQIGWPLNSIQKVVSIQAYEENEQMAAVVWFMVIFSTGGYVRVNAAHVKEVLYKPLNTPE